MDCDVLRRALLGKPAVAPGDLITVPACQRCNQDGGKDAEYFRVCLCLHPRAKNTRAAVSVKPKVQRSLTRPQAAGFRAAVLSSFESVGNRIAFTVDMQRIHSVIERTVQCLYFHEFARRIPDGHEVNTFSDEYLEQFSPKMVQ